ncbi:Non-specific lipid-transfer protein 3 [Morella rubra]|uniref:Non-specific lipid-transfer protein n=1 Tax=Morella rubra TaxID=262757 RepID=A0A6A1WH72_9ROSI|nr:Non-specific lipid-transfer protein 3 [Morella rubra]
MASSAVFKLACLLLLCMVVTHVPSAKASLSCNQVVRYLTPCVSYVANGGTVPTECCTGIKTLYSLAQTTVDRQSVCRCLKQAVSGVPYSAYNLGLASGLPKKCNVNIPYKISPSADCNKYDSYSLDLCMYVRACAYICVLAKACF